MGRVTTRGLGLAGTSVLLAAVLLQLAGAKSCSPLFKSLSPDLLRGLLAQREWGAINADRYPGLRVHVYPELPDLFLPAAVLPEGTVVEPFSPVVERHRKLVCGSRRGCLLVYVDTDPWAHYAHRVVIALWEIDSRTLQGPILAEWWPLVNGVPVLDTVEGREQVDYLWLGEPIRVADPKLAWGRAAWTSGPQRSHVPRPPAKPVPSGPFPTPTPPPAACPVWAVVVDGYDDPSDTFDEDAEGMYAVLTGLGVPESQVYYLSPHHGENPCTPVSTTFFCPAPPPDDACPTPAPKATCLPAWTEYRQRTSYCNLKHLMKKVLPARIGADGAVCDELLLFISSHGSEDYLYCGRFNQSNGSDCLDGQACVSQIVCAAELSEWLAALECFMVTIVVEACSSGSLIDDLQTFSSETQQQRRIFTSTDESGESHRDIDWSEPRGTACPTPGWTRDPNPGDSGSETIWGYIEAFGTGSADGAPRGSTISFAEAVDYARANDVMHLNCLNYPQVTPTPAPTAIAHSCAGEPGVADLSIAISAQAPGASTGALQVLSPRSTTVLLTVKSSTAGPMPGPVAAATVKVYWAAEPTPTWPDDFCNRPPGQYLDHQIGDTLLVTGLQPGEARDYQLTWEPDPSFASGDRLTLIAIVDSPQDPVPVVSGSPAQNCFQFVSSTNNAASTAIDVPGSPVE